MPTTPNEELSQCWYKEGWWRPVKVCVSGLLSSCQNQHFEGAHLETQTKMLPVYKPSTRPCNHTLQPQLLWILCIHLKTIKKTCPGVFPSKFTTHWSSLPGHTVDTWSSQPKWLQGNSNPTSVPCDSNNQRARTEKMQNVWFILVSPLSFQEISCKSQSPMLTYTQVWRNLI